MLSTNKQKPRSCFFSCLLSQSIIPCCWQPSPGCKNNFMLISNFDSKILESVCSSIGWGWVMREQRIVINSGQDTMRWIREGVIKIYMKLHMGGGDLDPFTLVLKKYFFQNHFCPYYSKIIINFTILSPLSLNCLFLSDFYLKAWCPLWERSCSSKT